MTPKVQNFQTRWSVVFTDMNAVSKLNLRAVVQGRVQGVGYRQFVLNAATQLELSGWVRNDRMDSNRVEVVAEGPQFQLEQLVTKLHQGPFAARVNEVATQWSEVTNAFDHFEIR